MAIASNSGQAGVARNILRAILRPELTLVVLMAVIIAMLIIPLPTMLIDVLIGLNIAIAIVIFLSSFYVDRILNFSTFPSVLLFTTLIRLALSVSTSRLILVDADAGHIVSAFGEFVVADNLVVGFVIFSIVTVVQFIVITKGSERIGEVAARFSLDGMPGKQMSIDADLRAESITQDEAQARRRDVETESQLYGSYDGAMKFVKGDAIAGIFIVLVNLFGGVSVGMLQKGMTLEGALSTYTLLTIGDGLVTQIPALLICISAGFIVTRVGGGSSNLGDSIFKDVFSSNVVLCVAAVLVLLLGLLPGFPFVVFLVLACGLLAMVIWNVRAASAKTPENEEQDAPGAEGKPATPGKLVNETVPVLVLASEAQATEWERSNVVSELKDALHVRFGLPLPVCVIRSHGGQDPNFVKVLINEIEAGRGSIVKGHSRVLHPTDDLLALEVGVLVAEVDGSKALWVAEHNIERVRAIGCETRSEFDELFRIVHGALARNVGEVFGIQEAKHLLDDVEKKYPELAKETYRNMPIQRIAEVMQRLLREHISIRNTKLVLETLAQWGQREKDVILLCEHVRGALARYISARMATDNRISALILSPEAEDLVRSGVRQSQGGAFLNLEPAKANELLERMVWHVQEATATRHGAVLLVAPDIRRFVKRFIENSLPDTHVISFSEVSDAMSIDVLRTI